MALVESSSSAWLGRANGTGRPVVENRCLSRLPLPTLGLMVVDTGRTPVSIV